jgi:phosphohistidine phosphatase
MKTLLIVRHGEAARGEDDRERALTAAGRQESADLGLLIRHHSLVPDLTLCSPARRAKETWREVAAAFGYSVQKRVVEAMYPGTPAEIEAAIAEVPAAIATLMIVGHNPGLHSLAAKLAKGGEPDMLAALASGLPTAGCVAIRFEGDRWDAPGRGTLVRFLVARADAEQSRP